MKTYWLLSIGLIFLIGTPCTFGMAATGGTSKKKKITLANVEDWDAILKQERADIEQLVKALSQIAESPEKPSKVRVKAINLLAKLGTDKSLIFLLENILLRIPPKQIVRGIDMVKMHPCEYALTIFARQNWNVIPNIMSQLAREKTKGELIKYATIMSIICGTKTALVIIKEKLRISSVKDVMKTNLASIQSILKKK